MAGATLVSALNPHNIIIPPRNDDAHAPRIGLTAGMWRHQLQCERGHNYEVSQQQNKLACNGPAANAAALPRMQRICR